MGDSIENPSPDAVAEFETIRRKMVSYFDDPKYNEIVNRWKKADDTSFPYEINYLITKQLEFLSGYFEALPKIISHYSSMEKSSLKEMVGQFLEFNAKVPQQTQLAIDHLEGIAFFVEVVSEVANKFENSVGKSDERVESIGKTLSSLSESSEKVAANFEKLKSDVGKTTGELSEFSAKANKIVDTVNANVESGLKEVRKKVENDLTETNESFRALANKTREEVSSVIKNFDTKADRLFKGLSERVESATTEVKEEYALLCKGSVIKYEDYMKGMRRDILNGVSKLTENCKTYIDNEFGGVKITLETEVTKTVKDLLEHSAKERSDLENQRRRIFDKVDRFTEQMAVWTKTLSVKIDREYCNPIIATLVMTVLLTGIISAAVIMGANKYVEIRTRDQAQMIAEQLHTKYLSPAASAKQLLRVVRKDGKIFVKMGANLQDCVGYQRADGTFAYYIAADIRDEKSSYKWEE
jgi:archaellum component FlaC